jgi:hypothetical protein
MKTVILFIWAIVTMALSHCSSSQKTDDVSGIIRFLSDTLNVNTKNISDTHIFFSDKEYKVFESSVKSITTWSWGYVPNQYCGTYYTFIHNIDTIGFYRLESFVKLYSKNDIYYFCGNTSFRGLGYFQIIKFNSSEAKQIFQSKDYTYNYSTDCFCYCDNNGYLQRTIKDINSDKIPDVIFDGTKCFYCDSLESGYGREDRSALKHDAIKFQFISKYDPSQKEINWIEDSTGNK